MKAVRAVSSSFFPFLPVLFLCPVLLQAQVTLTKSVNITSASPGNAVTYILNYANTNANTNCSDTFENDTLGAFPAGWTNSGGTWTIVTDNGPTLTGTQALQGVSAAGNYPYLLNNCGTQVGDGYIQTDMKIQTGTTETAVLLFRFDGTTTVNGSNYQALLNVGTANNVSVAYWNNPGAAFTSVATGSANITAGTWCTVKFEVLTMTSGGVSMNLYVNGTRAVSGTTTFLIPTGQGGIQSNSGSTIRFDNVSIVKYPPLYNVTVTDTLPVGLTYSSASGAPTVTGQEVVWPLGNLAAGVAGALTVVGTVNNCGLTLANTGELNGQTPMNSVLSNAVSTVLIGCTPTPTPSGTVTSTPTFTWTPTTTITSSFTFTRTFIPTATPTASFTVTNTFTFLPSNTFTNTITPTGTITYTPSQTDTFTSTFSLTSTRTTVPTPSSTNTFTGTFTPNDTSSFTPTRTLSPQPTNTLTLTNTSTPNPTGTFTMTATPSNTPTPTWTATDTPTATVSFTPTGTWTAYPTSSDTVTDTFTAIPSDTSTSTLTPVPTVSFTPTRTSTSPPIDTDTLTPVPTDTFTNTSTPTLTPTETESSTETPTVTNSYTQTGTWTPQSTNSFTATGTLTPVPSDTWTLTDTPTVISTDTLTTTQTPTTSFTPLLVTATETSTPVWTTTFILTESPTPTTTTTLQPDTVTSTPTNPMTGTFTPLLTDTPTPLNTQTATDTPTPTWTNIPNTATSTPIQVWTPVFTLTQTSSPTTTTTLQPDTVTSTPTQFMTGTSTPFVTDTLTPPDTQTATGTPAFTLTNVPDTATSTSTPVWTQVSTDTPTSTPTSIWTVLFTVTETPTPSASSTPTGTNISGTPTLTWTGTISPITPFTQTSTATPVSTASFTPSWIFSATATPEANCLLETVSIFDDRGELVRQLCGSGVFPGNGSLNLTFSPYQPLPEAIGGSLAILVNGKVVAVWDSFNQQGNVVPNGFYQVQLIQNPNFSNQRLISRDVYIDPFHSITPIQLSASPNIIATGGLVTFSCLVQDLPAGPGNEPLRIYTISGDLVKTLSWTNGQTSWNLTNLSGQTVASGLYLAAEETTDILSGNKIHKIVKVLFFK